MQERLSVATCSGFIAMAINYHQVKPAHTRATPPAGVDVLLSPQDIQGWLKISRPTFYRWLGMKTFPAHDAMAGCRPRWKRSSVQAWIDAGGTKPVK